MAKSKQDSFGRVHKADTFSSARRSTIIIMIVALVFSFLFYRSKTSQDIYMEPGEESIYLKSRSDDECTVLYEDITSVSLVSASSLDYGTMTADGHEGKKYKSGIYENEEFGTYSLFVSTSVDNAIILKTADTACVFNFESEDNTEAVYNALCKLLSEKYPEKGIAFDPAVSETEG